MVAARENNKNERFQMPMIQPVELSADSMIPIFPLRKRMNVVSQGRKDNGNRNSQLPMTHIGKCPRYPTTCCLKPLD